MDDFLKMDIFFVVTTVCVLLLTLLFASVLTYLILILAKVKQIADIAARELTAVAEDIHDVSSEIREGVSDVRKGVKAGAGAMRTYATAFRESGGLMELVGLLFNTVIEARSAKKSKRTRSRSQKDK